MARAESEKELEGWENSVRETERAPRDWKSEEERVIGGCRVEKKQKATGVFLKKEKTAKKEQEGSSAGGCRRGATGPSFIIVWHSFEHLKESFEPFLGHPTFHSLIKVLYSPFYIWKLLSLIVCLHSLAVYWFCLGFNTIDGSYLGNEKSEVWVMSRYLAWLCLSRKENCRKSFQLWLIFIQNFFGRYRYIVGSGLVCFFEVEVSVFFWCS